MLAHDVRGLEHAFTIASSALGARRLLSTPSEGPFGSRAWLGISSDLRPGPSPSLTGFTSGVSPGGLKFGLSPLRLPISPPGQNREAVYNNYYFVLPVWSQLDACWLLYGSWTEKTAFCPTASKPSKSLPGAALAALPGCCI